MRLWTLLGLSLLACAHAPPPPDDAVARTRFVHGAPGHGVPGPWALTGYRIGENALGRLGLTREQAWELRVTHRSQPEVRYTCMMDGLMAATGVSPGKMNLKFEPVSSEDALVTVVTQPRTHRQLTYVLKPAFRDRIRPVDFADFPTAERALAATPDDELFTVTESVAP
jgi:hypothetical protein